MNRILNEKYVLILTYTLFLSIVLSPYLPPVILIFIAFSALFSTRWYGSPGKWPEGIFLGFMAIAFLSWFFNPFFLKLASVGKIPVGLIVVLFCSLYYLLTYWIRNIVDFSWRDLQRTYLLFWLAGLYVAGIVIIQQVDWIGLKQSWLGTILDFYKVHSWQSEWSRRSVGTTGNSNTTAAMLICFSLLSIYASSVLAEKWKKIIALFIFIIFIYALAGTGSRGACIGLGVGLIVQLWMTGRRKWTIAITAVVLIAVFLQPEVIPRNDTFANTASARFKIWMVSFEIFKENWLVGTLPLHFGQIYLEKTGTYLYHAHNVFLGIAVEYGIIGFGLFASLLFVTIDRARKWRKAAKLKEEKRLAGVLLSQVMALLGHGMYDYPILSPQIGMIFFLSIIMIHVQYEKCFLDKERCQIE